MRPARYLRCDDLFNIFWAPPNQAPTRTAEDIQEEIELFRLAPEANVYPIPRIVTQRQELYKRRMRMRIRRFIRLLSAVEPLGRLMEDCYRVLVGWYQ